MRCYQCCMSAIGASGRALESQAQGASGINRVVKAIDLSASSVRTDLRELEAASVEDVRRQWTCLLY